MNLGKNLHPYCQPSNAEFSKCRQVGAEQSQFTGEARYDMGTATGCHLIKTKLTKVTLSYFLN